MASFEEVAEAEGQHFPKKVPVHTILNWNLILALVNNKANVVVELLATTSLLLWKKSRNA